MNESGKAAEKDEVTINIGMPRAVHRRLSISCAVLDLSLKKAIIAGTELWLDENTQAVAKALPDTTRSATAKRGRRSEGGEPEAGSEEGEAAARP